MSASLPATEAAADVPGEADKPPVAPQAGEQGTRHDAVPTQPHATDTVSQAAPSTEPAARAPLTTPPAGDAVAPPRNRRPRAATAEPVAAPFAASPFASGFPWERSPLDGIPSTKILAELQRRRERTAQLLAERDRIVQLMDAIEAQLQLVGHDVTPLSQGSKATTARRTTAARTGASSPATRDGAKGRKRLGRGSSERRG